MQSTGLWDEDLIINIFGPIDVNRILEISVAPSEIEDFVAWHHTKSEVFSVHSAYHAR